MRDIGIKIGLQGIRLYNSQIDKVESKTKGFATRVSRSIKGIAGSIPGIGGALSTLLSPMGLVSGGFALIASQAISATKTAAEFQQQMAQVAGLQQIDKASDAFKLLEAEAKRLGSTTEFSANQAGKAMEFLTRAGFSAQQTLDGIASTLALATVGSLDLGRASDIATDTLSQFGLEAKDLGSVVDIIAKTTVSANTNVTQFADAMNYLGATANALGVSLPESAAVIGVLSSAGLKGSLATRAFGTSLLRLTKPTSRAKEEIEKLGLNAFDLEGNFVGISNLIDQLETGFKGYTSKQKQAALTTIFGAEAIQEYNILLSKGSKELAEYTKEIEKAGEQNGKFSEGIRLQFLDTFAGSIKGLRSAWEGLQIALVGGGLDSLSQFVNTLADGIRYLTKFAEGTITLGDAMYDNIEIIGLVTTALLAFSASLVATKVLALSAAIKKAGGSMIFFNTVLRANIVGIVVTAVGLLVTGFIALYKRSQTLRAGLAGLGAFFIELGTIIKNGFLKVIDGVGQSFQGIFNLDFAAVKAGIKTAVDGLLDLSIITTAFKNSQRLADAFNKGFNDRIDYENAQFVEVMHDDIDDKKDDTKKKGEELGVAFGDGFGNGFTEQALKSIKLSNIIGSVAPSITPATGERDTALQTPDNQGGINNAIKSIGLDLQFVNENFANTNELLDAMSSIGFRVAESFGASTQASLAFAVSLRNLKQQSFEAAINIVANATANLGKQLSEAVKTGKDTAAAFRSFIGEIISQGLKYLGLFFLKGAATLGFPAGIPMAIAGIALLGLSGFASGLIGGSPQNAQNEEVAGVPGGASIGQGAIDQAQGANIGLSNIQQGIGNNAQNIVIFLDGEEITARVITSMEIGNQLTGQPG